MRTTRSASAAASAAAAAAAAGKAAPPAPPKPPPSPSPARERSKRGAAAAASPPPTSSPAAVKKPKKAAASPAAAKKAVATPGDPFPSWPRPTPAECWAVRDALAALHGEPPALPAPGSGAPNGGGDGCSAVAGQSVLGVLVRTILSQNTTDATSARAYASLRREFGGGGSGGGGSGGGGEDDEEEEALWERVRTAPPGRLEDSIRVGGLADVKAARIRAILDTLVSEQQQQQQQEAAAAGGAGARAPRPRPPRGPSLERLRALESDDDAKQQLLRFPGVGPKTASCVLLFALGRADFAVDTHVLHISASRALRWVPASASREAAYQHLNARVPAGAKSSLHRLLVEHGKRCPACARGGRLATTKGAEEGGWLGTERGRRAAEALASGEARCPLKAAAAGAGSARVKEEEEEEEDEQGAVTGLVAAAVKKEEELDD